MSEGPSDWFEWAAWRAEYRGAKGRGLSDGDARLRADLYWRARSQDAADALLAEVLAS